MSAYSTGHNVLMYGFAAVAVLLVLSLVVILVSAGFFSLRKRWARAPRHRVPVIRDERRAASVPHRPARPRFTHHRLHS